MKKIILTILVLSMLVLPACGKTNAAPGADSSTVIEAGDTVGSKYLAAFANSSATDAESVVAELLKLDAAGTGLVDIPVSEGYLDGFRSDITGFSKGVRFSPMIGSIPFVGYVFETDNPDALLALLTENADPAWNICTRADETVSYVRGNLVFFLMCFNE